MSEPSVISSSGRISEADLSASVELSLLPQPIRKYDKLMIINICFIMKMLVLMYLYDMNINLIFYCTALPRMNSENLPNEYCGISSIGK